MENLHRKRSKRVIWAKAQSEQKNLERKHLTNGELVYGAIVAHFCTWYMYVNG